PTGEACPNSAGPVRAGGGAAYRLHFTAFFAYALGRKHPEGVVMLTAFSSFLFAMSNTATALPPPRAAAQPGTPQTIVVVGQRLADLRAQLADCLARHCSPDEDIDVSTALAQALFVANEYREARSVLLASIGRNRRYAAQYPEPVSELYRSNALVARHLGFDMDAQRSTWEI